MFDLVLKLLLLHNAIGSDPRVLAEVAGTVQFVNCTYKLIEFLASHFPPK